MKLNCPKTGCNNTLDLKNPYRDGKFRKICQNCLESIKLQKTAFCPNPDCKNSFKITFENLAAVKGYIHCKTCKNQIPPPYLIEEQPRNTETYNKRYMLWKYWLERRIELNGEVNMNNFNNIRTALSAAENSTKITLKETKSGLKAVSCND